MTALQASSKRSHTAVYGKWGPVSGYIYYMEGYTNLENTVFNLQRPKLPIRGIPQGIPQVLWFVQMSRTGA